ncbi:hypothetical protein JOD57_000107 [Geodermatophilus bullaregiensis]|uniref:endonuclease domain-containing protein n=1 Tax=Geodermatophilus bullaregiensis TaxID=1564160 RepID=UPI00195B9922|nr:endonuclease domain-containing protein [Geodermatophilus bullaregiensis]MBM7804270.1 hypothetical protein [Geodermatophilus bullaregiensis]
MPEGHTWCPDRDTVKPLVEFPKTPVSETGRHTYCRLCHDARGRASREEVGGSRTYHLKRRYGITAEEADAVLAEQRGLCATREVAPAEHVDHDHVTGKVRVLLRFDCNGGPGRFGDDPQPLYAAVEYVARHRARHGRCGEEPLARR